MKEGVVFAVGAILGFVVARFLIEPSSCCNRVRAGVKSELEDRFGATVAGAVDSWIGPYTPGLLDVAGVD